MVRPSTRSGTRGTISDGAQYPEAMGPFQARRHSRLLPLADAPREAYHQPMDGARPNPNRLSPLRIAPLPAWRRQGRNIGTIRATAIHRRQRLRSLTIASLKGLAPLANWRVAIRSAATARHFGSPYADAYWKQQSPGETTRLQRPLSVLEQECSARFDFWQRRPRQRCAGCRRLSLPQGVGSRAHCYFASIPGGAVRRVT